MVTSGPVSWLTVVCVGLWEAYRFSFQSSVAVRSEQSTVETEPIRRVALSDDFEDDDEDLTPPSVVFDKELVAWL